MIRGRLTLSNQPILEFEVLNDKGIYSGRFVDIVDDRITEIFVEYENAVNEQWLSKVDSLDKRIKQFRFLAHLDDGSDFTVRDLQIYPSQSELSFVADGPSLS